MGPCDVKELVTPCIDHLLNEPAGGYGGSDPREMKSELIESWLAAHDRSQ
jgi:hypothetical protein